MQNVIVEVWIQLSLSGPWGWSLNELSNVRSERSIMISNICEIKSLICGVNFYDCKISLGYELYSLVLLKSEWVRIREFHFVDHGPAEAARQMLALVISPPKNIISSLVSILWRPYFEEHDVYKNSVFPWTPTLETDECMIPGAIKSAS